MTPEALLMMLMAILLVWGGLVGSIVNLRKANKREPSPTLGSDDDGERN